MTSTFPPISSPTACVWINGDAAEAATYYAQALPLTASAPGAGVTTLSIDGTDLLLLGADATYSPNPSISGFLRFSPDRFGSLEQAEQALRHTHTAISEGGELMPLQAHPFAPLLMRAPSMTSPLIRVFLWPCSIRIRRGLMGPGRCFRRLRTPSAAAGALMPTGSRGKFSLTI